MPAAAEADGQQLLSAAPGVVCTANRSTRAHTVPNLALCWRCQKRPTRAPAVPTPPGLVAAAVTCSLERAALSLCVCAHRDAGADAYATVTAHLALYVSSSMRARTVCGLVAVRPE